MEGAAMPSSRRQKSAATASLKTTSTLTGQTPLPGNSVPKFVDPLPTLSGARVDGTKTVQIDMEEFQQKVLPASVYTHLAAPYNKGTYLWGYNLNGLGASWPARTIEARQNGLTVIFSGHVLPEVERVADRVAIMRRGRLMHIEDMHQRRTRRLLLIQFAGPEGRALLFNPLLGHDAPGLAPADVRENAVVLLETPGHFASLVNDSGRPWAAVLAQLQ